MCPSVHAPRGAWLMAAMRIRASDAATPGARRACARPRRYVGMTWTSFAALARLSVPTVTVLKNLTNLFVIFGAPLL